MATMFERIIYAIQNEELSIHHWRRIKEETQKKIDACDEAFWADDDEPEPTRHWITEDEARHDGVGYDRE